MTVESSSRRSTFAGGQSSLAFSFRTLVSHPEYIKVVKTLISTGVDTALTYGVDYTVSVNANGVGGTVTVSPTFSTSYTMTVYRSTDDLQESDYDDYNQFPADTLEDDLDRRTLISQERSDDVDRVPTLPISYTGSAVSLPNPLNGYSLMWSGGNLVNSNLTGATGAIGPTGPAGPSGGAVSIVSSSTSEITVVSISTTPIITSVNAFTGGANVILRLDSNGRIPALDGRNLSAVPFYASTSGTLTTATSFTITGILPVTKYRLVFNFVQNTTTGVPLIRFNADSAANYLYYRTTGDGSTVTTAGGSAQTAGTLNVTVPSNSTGLLDVLFQSIQSNNNGSIFSGLCIGRNAGTSNFGGTYEGASTLTSITILSSAGTMTGSWALYILS